MTTAPPTLRAMANEHVAQLTCDLEGDGTAQAATMTF